MYKIKKYNWLPLEYLMQKNTFPELFVFIGFLLVTLDCSMLSLLGKLKIEAPGNSHMK